jgi:hypothetical protein
MNAQRAPAGGTDLYGHHYLGGEFLPFYVPRPAMPQVDEKDLPRLVADAMTGPRVDFDVVPVRGLRAHQRINHGIAQAMDPKVKLKPVIVSSDGYIVDGNHRWWAHVHAGDEWINVIRLGLSFDIAIRWVLARPYAYRLTPDTPVRD